MFKTLLFSIKKSKLLSKIAAESRIQHFDAKEILDRTVKGVAQGKPPDKRDLYIEQLLNLLVSDSYTNNLLAQHGRTLKDLRKIISKLELIGAGQIVKGHYVAVSSIAFLSQLRVILEHWDGENFVFDKLDTRNSNLKIAHYLLQSFE